MSKKILFKSLPAYFDEFVEALEDQIMEDNKRWGDTWKERGLVWNGLDQEARFFDWVYEKYMVFRHRGEPFPWLKVAGEAFIGYIREKYLGVTYE